MALVEKSPPCDAEPFTLRVDLPPRPRPATFDKLDRTRQRELFVGRNDLPGQTYLIPESNVGD